MAWLAPLPDAPPDVLGCLALRGEHLLAVDLFARLGLDAEPVAAAHALVVVRAAARRFALRASAVRGLAEGELRPLGGEAPALPCVVGLVDAAPPLPLLDVDALLAPELERLSCAGTHA